MQVAQDPEHNHLKEIYVSGVTVGPRVVSSLAHGQWSKSRV